MAEKLTPWDAPIPSKSRSPVNKVLEDIKRENKERMVAMSFGERWVPGKPISEYGKPKKWQFWKRIKSPLSFPLFDMSKGPFIYVLYVFLSGVNVVTIMSDPSKPHYLAAGGIGINLGFMMMTFMNRMNRSMDKTMTDMSIDLAKMETEFKIREEYRRKHGIPY